MSHDLLFKIKSRVVCFQEFEELKDEERGSLFSFNGYYAENVRLQDIVEVSYKLANIHTFMGKSYISILKWSSIWPHLTVKKKGEEIISIEFVYHADVPYSTVLFIGSLLRYAEEDINGLSSTLEKIDISEIKSQLDADLALAYISSEWKYSGHKIFTPNQAFKGEPGRFKKYINTCLSGKLGKKLPSSLIEEYSDCYSGMDEIFETFEEFKQFILNGEDNRDEPRKSCW